MSCKANSTSKSIKFQPMPMAALLASLKTLPAQLNYRDSSDSSDDSSSSIGLLPKKTAPVQPNKHTPIPKVARALENKENAHNKGNFFESVHVMPTIEASITSSQAVVPESVQKRAPLVEKKESVRCLFPEPVKEQSTKESVKEAPKETPSRDLTSAKEVPLESSCSASTKQLTIVAATPSQPQGAPNNRKIQFKTLNMKGKKFMIIKKLGVGGSSEVYKALEISSSNEYAVKCVNLATDREMAQGYLNEVRVLRELQKSDRVVKLYDYDYDKSNNILRLLIEVGETDLACYMREHRFGATQVLYYWEEMLHAVQQIHKHGIVHADLKPANFLMVSGRLKLIDFGIASAVSSDATSVVRSCGKGTFSYISPEALGGDGSQPIKVSFYSDVWSLGCILYSLVYGRTPFAHLPSMVKLITIRDPNHMINYPPVDDSIPPSLLTAMKECLQYKAHSRPTAAELLSMNHLKSSPQLPAPLLAKLQPHVTPEELALLRSH